MFLGIGKKLVACLFIGIISSCTSSESLSEEGTDENEISIRISTYNIRGDKTTDGINSWEFRKDSLSKIILKNDLEIIGM